MGANKLWEAKRVQFSWFSNEFENSKIDEVYRNLFGTESDSTQVNASFSRSAPFLGQARGVYKDMDVVIRNDSHRLDLIVAKKNDENTIGEFGPFGQLLSVNHVLEELKEKITNANFTEVGCVSRLSLITNLSKCKNNIKDINNFFLELCPLSLKANEVKDLMFRFNKTKYTGDFEINRLVNYNVQIIEEIINFPEIKTFYDFNVILDFNTVPVEKINTNKQTDIWNILFDEISSFVESPMVTRLE